MNTQLQITEATEKDIDELVALVNSAYRGEGSKQGWTTEADLLGGVRTSASSMAEQFATPGAVVLKAVNSEEKIKGCVYLQQKEEGLYLGMLTVAPHLQGGGVGKALLAAADSRAKSLGCHRIYMSVITVRHELIDWYLRHGYKHTGQTLPFPTDPKFGVPKQPLEFLILEKNMVVE